MKIINILILSIVASILIGCTMDNENENGPTPTHTSPPLPAMTQTPEVWATPTPEELNNTLVYVQNIRRNNVFIRDEPDLNGEVLGVLLPDEVLGPICYTDDIINNGWQWLAIWDSSDGVIGWIALQTENGGVQLLEIDFWAGGPCQIDN